MKVANVSERSESECVSVCEHHKFSILVLVAVLQGPACLCVECP